jgi:hypothetical protein
VIFARSHHDDRKGPAFVNGAMIEFLDHGSSRKLRLGRLVAVSVADLHIYWGTISHRFCWTIGELISSGPII